MTTKSAFPPRLAQLVERWETITASASEMERVGVVPRQQKKRGLIALLAHHSDGELDRLAALCLTKSEACSDETSRTFWRNRIPVVEEVKRDKKALLARERRRKRAKRKAEARKLELSWQEAQNSRVDKRLGLSRVQPDQMFSLNRPVQGGAPGGKR